MSDEKIIHLDIVTPSRLVYSGPVTSFSAPGIEGGFQILFNHAPYLVALKLGVIKIVEADGDVILFATSGGFVEIHNNKVIVLAETAHPASEIDVEHSQEAILEAQSKLQAAKTPEDIELLRETIQQNKNKIITAQKAIQ